MCGRYTLRRKLNLLLSEFAADLAPGVEWEPRYNIPPTANVPAVRLVDGKRQLTLFQWGLVPSWTTPVSNKVLAQYPMRYRLRTLLIAHDQWEATQSPITRHRDRMEIRPNGITPALGRSAD
jgi:putative SOS response-associated peptidase YedK